MSVSNHERVPVSGAITDAVLEIWAEVGARNHLDITGNSMLPLIKDRDRVLVKHGTSGIRRGDVVVFRYGNGLAAHRVIHIYGGDDGPTFVTKGDNSPQFDPPSSAGEIVGRVLSIERGGKHMPLDTAAWRTVGWLIAIGTLTWTKLYGFCWLVKQRVLGPQPNRLTSFLRRSAQAFFSLALRVVQTVFCQWKDGAPSSSKE